jgi:hypothetical protein
LRFYALVAILLNLNVASVLAQELPAVETQLLNEKVLSEKLGPDWRGIIYVCDPYCEFISLKETKQWNPSPGQIRIRLEKLKAVAQTDPLYPLLISNFPVLPYVEVKAASVPSEKKKNLDRRKPPPSYAQTSYGLGWSLGLGETLALMRLSSNTEIQTRLASEEYFLNPSLHATLALRPHRLYRWWIQHRLEGFYTLGSYQTSDDLEVKTSSQSVVYKAINFGRRIRQGPRVTWRTDEVKVKNDSLTHFSYSWNAYLLGWEAIWRRWSLYGDISLMSTIEERQAFRQAPLKQTWYRVGVGYCSRDFSLFDISFGFCSNFDYAVDKQKAALANNLISSDSQIDISRMELGFALRVGEDLFK